MNIPAPHISSDIAKLEMVIIHEPGIEVEKVTPSLAEQALYGDILNLTIARREYYQFSQVLKKCTNTITLKELFELAVPGEQEREYFIHSFFKDESKWLDTDQLVHQSSSALFESIVTGVDYKQKTISNYLKHQQFITTPLHNLFFTRDIGFCIGDKLFTSSMAKEVRKPEALLANKILAQIDGVKNNLIPLDTNVSGLSIEGGDVIVFNDKTVIVGLSNRTSSEGVDKLIADLSGSTFENVILQELPKNAISFIHLDMVFTLLGTNQCMVYKPVIFDIKLKTLVVSIKNGEVQTISEQEHIPGALTQLGVDMQPVFCGNDKTLFAEREQWHSGANFLALAPGKLIGYERNFHTNEALNNEGFAIIKAEDFLSQNKSLEDFSKCIITIEGSELARGGGGPRCMSLPVVRE